MLLQDKKEKTMKLNTKTTVLVGFAFMAICAFWQMYDGIIPKILTETFKISESVSGYIMAADNVLALFLLPFFGGLSDRSKFKMGRRRPFILFGTLLAVAFMVFLPIIDDSYYAAPSASKIVFFVIVLALVLFAMGTYRSPAVALMPDVTPKPLRSKANAIINVMGALGGIIYLVLTSVLYSQSKTEDLEHISYLVLFLIVAFIMLIALAVVMIFVNEPALCKKQEEYEAAHPESDLTEKKDENSKATLPKAVKKSLIFILLSIALWYIAYNGVSTWFTTYAKKVWDMDIGLASMCLTVATAGAFVGFIPSGALAEKTGRKRAIQIGVLILALCFASGFVCTFIFDRFNPVLYVIFAFVGLGWSMINVNSLPMVVEICSGADVGKFTGYYYAFSMSAQIITPILAGYLLENVGYNVLFLYSASFSLLAFVTMCFVKHGDTEVQIKKGLEAFDVED